MNCIICGGKLSPRTGPYQYMSDYVGPIAVELKGSMECERCKEILLSWEDAELVDKLEKDVIDDFLQCKPVRDFITEKDAASILGKTKQAVSKHPRIKRGFIFQTHFGGRKMYLRESVELYKVTDDGRFCLTEKVTATSDIKDFKPLEIKDLPAGMEFKGIPLSEESSFTFDMNIKGKSF